MPDEIENTIRQLEERLLQPDVRKSAEEVDNLLADEFIEIGSSGQAYNKTQIMDGLQQEPSGEIRRTPTDFSVTRLATDVVLITYRVIRLHTLENRKAESLRSSIWILRDGRWQMIFHQGTPVSAAE